MSYLDVIYQEIKEESYAGSLQQYIESTLEPDKSKLIAEIKCFELMLLDGNLEPIFRNGNNKRTDIDLITNEEVLYIKNRLETETLPFLISRYSHILYIKTRNNQYALKAIKTYNDLAQQYLKSLQTKEKNILDFIEVSKAYVNLSLVVKYELDTCRNQIFNWYRIESQNQFYYKCLLELLAESKLFKKAHLSNYTESAIKHFNAINCGFEAEDYLETCIKVAKKEWVSLSAIYILMAENQLKLADKRADDETGMVKADCYLKASLYYKFAKELKKSNEILRKLDAHKKNIKLGSVSTSMNSEEVQDYFKAIKSLAQFYISAYPQTIFIGLAIDKRVLPNTNDFKRSNENNFLNFCRVSAYDININTRILNDFEKRQRDLFVFYKIGLESTIPFLIKEIKKIMEEKDRDFLKEGILYFENTWFKSELQQTILSQEPQLYDWMQSIKPALEILLSINIEKINNILTAEEQMAFDQLSIKFEGIFRDLCSIANITVTRVRENQITNMDINELLQNNEIEAVFEKQDIEFWQFAFTACGYNIRNNVAHAFYRPHNYKVNLSNILLMAYIRLAKYGSIVSKATQE